MSSNFLQFNPTQANQETDAQYLTDTTRTSGAGVDAIWPSKSANKTLYQLSTGVAALMQMMANKNFTCDDTNLATLTAVLANILTTADIRSNMKVLTYASSLTLNVGQSLGFYVQLAGNVTFTFEGVVPGDRIALIVQQSTGGGTIAFSGSPATFGFTQPYPAANATTVYEFEVDQSGQIFTATPAMQQQNGSAAMVSIDRTPIGPLIPSTGAFTTLSTSGAASLASLIVTGLSALNGGGTTLTPSATDNTTKIATTAWAQLGFSVSLTANGFIKFPTWLGGWTVQWCQGASLSNETPQTTNFPAAFSTACLIALVNPLAAGTDFGEQISFSTLGWTSSGVSYYYERNSDHSGMTVTPLILAIGH